ncbi:MAG TPA: acyltransferase [Fimbriimonadaceae bacterium]|nr:acyltransferase [Fimbriimonadaceae bacterium]
MRKDITTGRDVAFDVAKGVGIVAVVGLHLSNRSASAFHDSGSPGWWVLKWTNLFLNFCVPLFLIVSAILLARSASRQEKPDWKRFAWRRVRSILGPLVVWSVLYWLMRAFVQHDARVLTPGFWSDVKGRLMDVAFGKAEFHLYFMSILAQVCLILPLFVVLFRRVRLDIWIVLLIAIILQGASFALQKVVLFPYPGSTVFWYFSSVIPGIWIGMNWRDWPSIRRATWPAWALLAAAGFAVFGYDSWLVLTKQQPNGTVMNAAASAYALGMPFLIIGLLTVWVGRMEEPSRPEARPTNLGAGRPLTLARTTRRPSPPGRRGVDGAFEDRLEACATGSAEWLRRLGTMSLQIYLMHPVLMEVLTTSWRLPVMRRLPLPSVWLFLITLFGTYGIALLLSRTPYADQILFGKELPPKRQPAAE